MDLSDHIHLILSQGCHPQVSGYLFYCSCGAISTCLVSGHVTFMLVVILAGSFFTHCVTVISLIWRDYYHFPVFFFVCFFFCLQTSNRGPT